MVTETWLNSEVESTFDKIRGYTHWARRDRHERAGGGVAVCFKEGVQAQNLDVDTPPQMEVMFFRVVLKDRSVLLLCAMYRPPRQGPVSLQYLTETLDELMLAHRCRHVMVMGDLNHHLEQDAYENLLTVHGLTDHITFPTHERDGTLDPVISDLQEDTLRCYQLGLVGSSDHHAVLTQVDLGVARDEATSRTVWLWDKSDWESLRRDLRHTAWETLLQGGMDNMSRAQTSRLLALQRSHIPHREYTTRPTDQSWFGYRCCVAAEAKYSARFRYKRNPAQQESALDGMQEDGVNKQMGHKKLGGRAPQTDEARLWETTLGGPWSRRSRESAAKTPSLPSPRKTEQWSPAARRRPSCWLISALKR